MDPAPHSSSPDPDDPARALIESAGLDETRIGQEHLAGVFSLCGGLARLAAEEEYDETRAQFPDEEIFLEDGSIPYVRTRNGPYELRYFPPAAVEIHLDGHGEVWSFSLYSDAKVPAGHLALIRMGDLRRLLAAYVRLEGHGPL
jgi:hypothetical protein